MISHHSSICNQIAESELSENGFCDCILNGKKIEFKESVTRQVKLKYEYVSYVVSKKDLKSDYLVFINHPDEIYSMMDGVTFSLLFKKQSEGYTRLSDKKVQKNSLFVSSSCSEFKKKFMEVIYHA